MRLYRYRWTHAYLGFAPQTISLRIEIPTLRMRADISRHKPGWYHWVQIRCEEDDFPIVQCSGPIAFVFKVIRATVASELGRRLK